MLSASKIEGGTQNISPGLRMTIETLKEVAKGHSEEDIYATLKESNMDPNETFQKLSHQDTFHEVRRRRDRKKEAVNEPSEHTESTGHKIQDDRKEFESANVNLKPKAYLHRNIRRGPYKRNPLSGTRVNREFRVVKDKRTNHDTDKDTLDPAVSEPAMPASLESAKGSSNNKVTGGDDPHANVIATNGNLQTGAMKQNVSKPRSTTSSNNSVLGVYSSSTDPVHVPSHGSRSATNVGAIKRDVGVVGARRQSTEANNKPSSSQGGSSSNYHAGQHRPPSRGNPRSFGSFPKSDQNAASVSSSHPNGRSFSSYQHNPRPNQSVVHQKSAQPSKEWKPKVSQKLVADASEPYEEKPGKSAAPASSRPNHLEEETSKLPDKVSRVNISENVIIAPHLRVESEKYHLTFGCLDADSIPSKTSAEEQNVERSESLFVSVSDRLVEEPGAENNQLVLSKDVPQSSGSSSPLPGSISVPPQIDKKESSVLSELVNYSDLGLVRDAATSFEPQRQPDASDISSFSVYDPQTGYDLTYFRPNTADEAVRGHGLLSSQEVLISHTGNSIPSSSIGMVSQVQQQPQQQQQAVAQLYPQVHLPHFTSIMPYRQFISPVYVPPMAVQGYSGNPAFSHHPSNGSSYVLMPGATSHLSASGGLKYGMQQYKPVPTGTQTGFGSFTGPTGYAMNAPGVIGNATGLDDSARLKFKDANLYVPNPQAETSEIWMNAREVVPNMQTASYFNMPAGQAPHAGPAAYMTSPHSGHPSFNAAAAVAQSSHMQFPMYHHQPPQPAMIGNPHHHMGGGAVGGNVGVGIAAAAVAANPGGAYQQPQLGHLNWTAGNF